MQNDIEKEIGKVVEEIAYPNRLNPLWTKSFIEKFMAIIHKSNKALLEELDQLIREKDIDGMHEDAWKLNKTYKSAIAELRKRNEE